MAVAMEAGSRWRKRHDAGREFVLQSSNSSTKSEDSSKPSTSSTSGGSTMMALGRGGGGGGGGQKKKRGWGDELHKAVQLMLGQVPERETLDFLGVSNACEEEEEFLELDPNLPLPVGWEKCLDLRTGGVHYLNRATGEKTVVDPRQVVSAAAAPATPSYHDAEADRNSDSPGTPPGSAARNFLGSRSSSSPSPRERAIESSSPSRGGSGLFLGSCVSTAGLTEQAEPGAGAGAAAPMPWALEHWAAAAKGFSERNPLPAAAAAAPAPADFRFRWLQARSPEGGAAAPLEDLNCGDDMGSNLELKLSSSTLGLVKDQGTSVCTMQKVKEALQRSSDKMVAGGKKMAVAPPAAAAAPWSLLNLRSPASPSHSSSSASSSTPPSVHDLARASPPKRFRSSSPPTSKSLQLRVSSPNCVSSCSNVSSPAHPSSAGCPESGPCPGPSSSTISPNLASLKLAELESGSPSQVLTLGGGGSSSAEAAQSGGPAAAAAVSLACCKSCLMYMLLSKEDPRCPRCHNSVDVAFAPSSLPPLKKAKVEVDV